MKLGFILVENLIYIVLSAMFFLFMFQFTTQTYIKYQNFRYSNSQASSLWMALDLITKDIQKASSNNIILKNDELNSSLIVSYNQNQSNDDNYSVAWIVQNSNLYRIQGKYNATLNKWSDKTESLVYSNIKKFSIYLNKSIFLDKLAQIKNGIKILLVELVGMSGPKQFVIKKSIRPRCVTIII